MGNIVVYKEKLLSMSETFILQQIKNIKSYDMCLVGLRCVCQLDISKIRYSTLEGKSNLGGLFYKIFGVSTLLKNLILSNKPSLVHVHMGGDAANFIKIREKLDVPVIVTFHGTDATTTDTWKLKNFYFHYRNYVKNKNRLIDTTDQFIAISNFVKRKMIEQGFPSEKIKVHYIGIDLDLFCAENETQREPIVLFVGRLTKQKGCAMLIEAMGCVLSSCPDSNLVIIGDGPEKENLEKFAAELNVPCSFFGAHDQGVVKRLLSRSKVFCCPSIDEGLGIVFLEAQAMGTPVVSFYSGGIPEAVISHKTGFLYPEKDITGLAQGITKLLTDDALWDTFSKNGVEHVKNNFDIKKQTVLLEQLYTEVINAYKA
jgi:colanic acid/amylovoran biosynthesis glycosyltransferase